MKHRVLRRPRPENNIPPPGWTPELDRLDELDALTWLYARR